MKNFLSSFLGALAALLLFVGGTGLMFIGFLGILVSAGSKKAPTFESGSYVVFDLGTNITDSPALLDFSELTDGRPTSLQLRTVIRALRAAAVDRRIKGLVLIGNLRPTGFGSGYAALREVRGAIEAFHKEKKPVQAYLETVTTKDYYLASAADDVSMDPYGLLFMPGLASEPVYFAGLFEKYGIGVQVTRVGKFKSYVEPYTRKNMSPEDREQLQKLLGDLWGSLLSDIGASRRVPVASLQAAIDAEGFLRPEAAIRAKLVDRVAYRDQMIDSLRKATGVTDPQESFLQVSLSDYIKAMPKTEGPPGSAHARVAIVYAEGEIVDGEGEPGQVGGVRFARELRSLRNDEDVKAVVLRVNSPGGSASASEAIEREMRLLKAVKPVIVSMGTYAASGGYWISAYSNRIYAEPTSVTGSIGVFGIQFDVQRLANDFGITFDSVKTGKYADMITLSRPKTPDELAVIQRIVDWEYDQFIVKVSEGRRLKPEFVREIAEGRVWSGSEAKKLGLVDELGTLADSVRYAAKEAGLANGYRVEEYPAKQTFSDAVKQLLKKEDVGSVLARPSGLLGLIEARFESQLKTLGAYNDPKGVYALLPLDLNIH